MPDEIFFAGDGSGGGLLFSALLKFRSIGLKMPNSAAAVSPITDFSLTAKSILKNEKIDPVLNYDLLKFCADNYVGENGDRCNPFISPFYGDLTGIPPLLIMVGEKEILLDDAMRFAKKSEFYGVDSTFVVAKEMIHNWAFFAPIINEGQQAVDYIGQYFSNHFGWSENT